MELRIFDSSINLIGIVDTFMSFRCNRKYFDVGECELHIPFSIEALQILKVDNIIYLDNENSFIIHTVQIDLDNEGNEFIQVLGKSLVSILDRRIMYGQVIVSGVSANNLVTKLLNENVISPTDVKRKISNFIVGDIVTLSNIDYQNSYANILEELLFISKTHDIHFYIELDYINKKLIFRGIRGIDKSTNQAIVSPCIFSQDYENIEEQTYVNSFENERTVTLVCGTGEGVNRKRIEVGEGEGLLRKELYTDADDISEKKENSDGSEVSLSQQEYLKMLSQRGYEKLKECAKVETLDSQVSLTSNLTYKNDFNLGDIVTVLNKKWNLKVDTRITEIEEIWEEDKNINLTFGNNLPTLIQKLKNKMR